MEVKGGYTQRAWLLSAGEPD